jgi:hypothetical protein
MENSGHAEQSCGQTNEARIADDRARILQLF